MIYHNLKIVNDCYNVNEHSKTGSQCMLVYLKINRAVVIVVIRLNIYKNLY